MSGYTSVFDTVFQGTLCGRWPTLPVWLTILPMADKNGHINMTYQAISAVTGWPIDLLKQAIAELMAPDPESRTAVCEGRRLELIDPQNRQWGWRVINHALYREKARLQAKAARENADRRSTPVSAGLRRSTPVYASPNSKLQTTNILQSERPIESVLEKQEAKSALASVRAKLEAMKDH